MFYISNNPKKDLSVELEMFHPNSQGLCQMSVSFSSQAVPCHTRDPSLTPDGLLQPHKPGSSGASLWGLSPQLSPTRDPSPPCSTNNAPSLPSKLVHSHHTQRQLSPPVWITSHPAVSPLHPQPSQAFYLGYKLDHCMFNNVPAYCNHIAICVCVCTRICPCTHIHTNIKGGRMAGRLQEQVPETNNLGSNTDSTTYYLNILAEITYPVLPQFFSSRK